MYNTAVQTDGCWWSNNRKVPAHSSTSEERLHPGIPPQPTHSPQLRPAKLECIDLNPLGIESARTTSNVQGTWPACRRLLKQSMLWIVAKMLFGLWARAQKWSRPCWSITTRVSTHLAVRASGYFDIHVRTFAQKRMPAQFTNSANSDWSSDITSDLTNRLNIRHEIWWFESYFSITMWISCIHKFIWHALYTVKVSCEMTAQWQIRCTQIPADTTACLHLEVRYKSCALVNQGVFGDLLLHERFLAYNSHCIHVHDCTVCHHFTQDKKPCQFNIIQNHIPTHKFILINKCWSRLWRITKVPTSHGCVPAIVMSFPDTMVSQIQFVEHVYLDQRENNQESIMFHRNDNSDMNRKISVLVAHASLVGFTSHCWGQCCNDTFRYNSASSPCLYLPLGNIRVCSIKPSPKCLMC